MSLRNRPALISIIMPAYNCGLYVSDAIQSVMAQSYPHWELILLNDASTDDTQEAVQPYLTEPRIRYICLEKVEHSSAARVRNLGIQQAQGEYIAFLDADDCFNPEALSILLQEMQALPEIMMAQGFYTSIDSSGESIRTLGLDLVRQNDGHFSLPAGFRYSWSTLLNVQFPCMLGTSLFRKSVFDQIGLFSEALTHSEDFEYYLRLFQHWPKAMRAIPAYTYKYRFNPTSLTKAQDQYQRQIDCHFKLLESVFLNPILTQELQSIKSYTYAHWFRLFARQQLNSGRPHLARVIIWQALQHQNFPKTRFVPELFPLALQSLVSPNLYQCLANTNRRIRQHLDTFVSTFKNAG